MFRASSSPHPRRSLLGIAVVALCAAGAWLATHEIAEMHAYGFEKVSIPGVSNAGRINAHLYRGAQPTAAGLAALRSLGVDTIVSFTLEGNGARAEAETARSLGLRYVHMPWSANSVPPDRYVTDFLELASPTQSRVVFVHCKAGADRTGLMIAAYRMLSDGWTFERAMDEMNAFGYEVELHPQLRRFARALANKVPRHATADGSGRVTGDPVSLAPRATSGREPRQLQFSARFTF